MSNIFAPLVRPFGTLPIVVESGPAVGHEAYMHMLVDDDGLLLCSNDQIHHYGAAVPFDINGRVVISASDVARWDQGIPFTASGAVAVLLDPSVAQWDQGLTFLSSGHIAAGDTPPAATAPVWSTIPYKLNYAYELDEDYPVSQYVSSGGEPITSYGLTAPPDFFTINPSTGVINCGVGTAVAAHNITVTATNIIGTSSNSFIWEVITGNEPTWTTIPPQSHRQNQLDPSGKTLDVKPYASSDSGPILTYTLLAPPAGITMANGVVTVAAGTAVDSYVLTVRATNGVGAGDTVFTWDILETLKKPQWSTIPNTSNVTADLPGNPEHDVSPYVSTQPGAGALRDWQLITPPVGFTIDSAGVVTASVGAAIAAHTIVVQVRNDIGTASRSFTWTITEELLPPTWDPVTPEPVTSEELLPAPFDVSQYASSNSGPLTGWTLNPPVAGFSINTSGVITAALGIAPGTYPLIVEVTNGTGTTASAPFDWEILLYYVVPLWITVPGQSHGDDELPATLDLLDPVVYVTSNAGPLTGWAINPPVTGFSILDGVITVDNTAAEETAHQITVEVTNDEGTSAADAFTWIISNVLLPPAWSPDIPNQNTREDALPDFLLASDYVSSNGGQALTGWGLVIEPVGFHIDANGRIDVDAGTAPGTYTLQVTVTNPSGTRTSNIFDWVIGAYYTAPVWNQVPDDKVTEEQLQPAQYDVSGFVDSNHGTLFNWVLVNNPPSGFTIDDPSIGVITVVTRPPGDYLLTVEVSNLSGSTESGEFTWTILIEPALPVWDIIPDRQDRVDTLPQDYGVSGYASSNSNSGPLVNYSIEPPVTGFSIHPDTGVITVIGE